MSRKAQPGTRRPGTRQTRSSRTDTGTAVTPTKLLADYLRCTVPGQVISWADMEREIGKAPKMYWKGARRVLKKEDVCFSIVDGVGLQRTSGRMQNRAVKVELNVDGMTERKRKELYQNAGFARFVYNWTLAQCRDAGMPIGGKAGADARRDAVERKKRGEKVEMPKVDWNEISRRWTQESQTNPELAWTRDRIGHVSRFAIAAVKDAYQHAFRRARSGGKPGWPKFHGKGARRGFSLQSQTFRHTKWSIKIGKLGMIPIRNARRHDQLEVLEGARILRLAIEEKAGRWWCSIMYEREDETPKPARTGKIAGVDLGYAITISDGTEAPPVYEPPRALASHLVWLKHWGKAMSRRYQKGKKVSEQSKRWWRAKKIVQELHLRIAHIRKDWVEQISDDLTKRYDVIVTEGFDVLRFVSEEVDYVKGRRTILDVGWGMLRSALKRKAEERGKRYTQLEKHDATDQTCSRCGANDERKDGLFQCESCGHEDLRPRNTADLLYRIATGDAPDDFPGVTRETLAGEAGDNTRGGRQERSSGFRRSETGDVDPEGPRGQSAAHFSTNARGAETTANARHATARKEPKRGGKRSAGTSGRGNARKHGNSSQRSPRANARSAKVRRRDEAAE